MTTPEAGRFLLIQLGNGASPEVYTTVGGLRTTDVTIETGAVDTTNKDSGGVQQIGPGLGVWRMSVTGQGIFDDSSASLKAVLASGVSGYQALLNMQLLFGNGDKYTGKFNLKTEKRSGSYQEAEMYDVTLDSSGTIVFAAGT